MHHPSRLRPAILWLASCLILTGGALAQVPAAPPATPAPAPEAQRIPLEDVVTKVGGINGDLAKRIEAVGLIIDTEVAAGRVPANVGQVLHWSLQNASLSSGPDLTTQLSINRLPVENAKIMAGIRKLQTEWSDATRQYAALIHGAIQEAGLRVAEVTRAATKVDEIDALTATLEHIQTAVPIHSPSDSMSIFPRYLEYLRNLRSVIAMDPHAPRDTGSSPLVDLQSSAASLRGALSEADLQHRVQQTLVTYQKAADEAQDALDSTLLGNKPATAATAALARFEEATAQIPDARSSYSQHSARETTGVLGGMLGVYRHLVDAAGAIEAGDATRAHTMLSNLQASNLLPLGTAKATRYQTLVATWEKSLAEKGSALAQELRTQLAAVKTPTDLGAIAARLSEAETAQRRERDPIFPRGLGAQLNALASAWIDGNPALLAQQAYQDPSGGSYTVELAHLREHIQRDMLATSLHAPELNKPPLADLPLQAALAKLSEQIAAASDWRRLLLVLQARNLPNGGQGYPEGVDLASAVQTYLAGQNFELAEQWADAVQCYKSVLRCTDNLAPIQQSAERLKDLKKSHPEIFSGPVINPASNREEQ